MKFQQTVSMGRSFVAAMESVAQLVEYFRFPHQLWGILLHMVVITLVPVLLLAIFLIARVSTQLTGYLADSWTLKRLPRYRDALGAWKMCWSTLDWTRFCERMRRKDGTFPAILNCGPSVEGRHWLAVSDPELIKTILTTPEPDEETLGLYSKLRASSPTFADAVQAWIGEGLLSSQGTQWHIHRKACTPLFFFTVLQGQLPLISKSAHDMIRSIRMAERAKQARGFVDPTSRLSSHIMRCLLHLIVGQDAVREANTSVAKHSIEWMVQQQHNLVQNFRASLNKTSFLGGRVWHIFGGRLSNMLPWVGGEGSLHALQKERHSFACYFQSQINRLRWDENDEDGPSESHDLLSLLFNLKLDEDFAIQQHFSRTAFNNSLGSTQNFGSLGTPSPPLPTRRSLLLRSQTGIKKGIAALVLTPPGSTSSSSTTSPSSSSDSNMDSNRSQPATPTSSPPTPLSDSFRNTGSIESITVSPESGIGSDSDRSQNLYGTDSETELAQTEDGADEDQAEYDDGDSESDFDLATISDRGWETSSDGSAHETDDDGEKKEEDEGEKKGKPGTREKWTTMQYNGSGDGEISAPDPDEDPDSVPGSQPPRAGHLPDETIIDQAFTFLAAGFQPLVSTIMWCLYHLAKDPSLHARIQSEVHAVLDGQMPHVTPTAAASPKDPPTISNSINGSQHSGPISPQEAFQRARASSGLGLGDVSVSADQIARMSLTRNLVKEVLRFHPTQPVIERITTEEVKLKSHTIPEGTALGLMIWNVHRDPTYWKEPERFWPDRFDQALGSSSSSSSSSSQVDPPCYSHPFAYVPFSGGNHSCLGQKFVMQCIIITVALMVRAFDFELNPEDRVEERFYDGILSPSPFGIRFTLRDFLASPQPPRRSPGISPITIHNKPKSTTTAATTTTTTTTTSTAVAPRASSSNEESPASPGSTPTLSRRLKRPSNL
jgi:cytochrome P450